MEGTTKTKSFERGRLERWMGLSRWYLEVGRVEAALRQVEHCLAMKPEDPELIRITAEIADVQRRSKHKLQEY